LSRPLVAAASPVLLRAGAAGRGPSSSPGGGSPADSGSPPEPTNAVDAIAVLPFENVGGDPKTEYLSDGVADHLINSLSQVRRDNLQVRPFTSVSRYKRQKTDVPTMGRELKVQRVVTGTLHQQGDDLSISVATVDARNENQLWGDRYRGSSAGSWLCKTRSPATSPSSCGWG